MTSRVLAALPLLLLGVVGCVEEQRSLLVAPNDTLPKSSTTALRPPVFGPRVASHEASAQRVLAVSGKLFDANPRAGMRPLVITVGVSHPEIFHTGGGTRGFQLFVSEGLISSCRTDAQLAAALALEMGKIVAERAATGAASKDDFRLPPDVPVGTDSGGTFGPADGTRMMELARLDPKRPKPGKKAELPSPEALAKTYLEKAGYDAGAIAEVAPLLRKAEENYQVEKTVKQAELGAPVKAEEKKAK